MRHLPFIAVLCGAASVLPSFQAAAKSLTTLFNFRATAGRLPEGSLIADAAGNLYGTTVQGGLHKDGTVFELMPPAAGQNAWTEIVLFSFDDANGQLPYGSLVADGAGNLYGATSAGGAYGLGTVFELTPPAVGQTAWTETVLFSFNGTDGENPNGSLIADKAGNLYGTTVNGGSGYGTVYELSPPMHGKTAWTETVLFSFNGANGNSPFQNLIPDQAGNLYGTTQTGGTSDFGTVFELTPPAMGQTAWIETVLLSFNGTDGENPYGGLIADKAGNFYSTTTAGGASGLGTVFEMTPPVAGQTAWTETVLFSFDGTDGDTPRGSLLADKAGSFYGTTFGDKTGDNGTVYKLKPPAVGQTAWTETVLVDFNGRDGNGPGAGLIADKAGYLYGTTGGGGKFDYGTVFKLHE